MAVLRRKWIPGLVIALGLVGGAPLARLALEARQSMLASVQTPWWGSRTDQLISNLQQRLRQNPADGPSYTELGNAYLQKVREVGDPSYYPRAEGVLKKALELNPQDFAAMSALGALALARHQFSEALAWGQQARDLDPGNARHYGVMGDAQIELGLYADAIATFQTMVDLKPSLSSYARVSYARELMGDVAGAMEAMRWAVAAGSPNAENTNWVRVQLGNLYFNRGDLAGAEAQYQQALQEFPGYVHALAGLARVQAARGDLDGAIALYTRAVETMPLPEFVIALGDVYQVAGRHDDASRQYDLVRAIAQLYATSGVDTDLEMALFDADHQINLDAAQKRAQAATLRRPSIYAADVLAWTLYQAGRCAEALEFMTQALHLGTQDALLHFHAGMIHHCLGDRAQAKAHLAQALLINPYFSLRYAQPARSTLAQLEEEL